MKMKKKENKDLSLVLSTKTQIFRLNELLFILSVAAIFKILLQ